MGSNMKGFVNPYNFIKFPDKKAEAYNDTDKHTGVIEYTITTKTPLFIPNSSSESAFTVSDKVPDHKSYDFFSYTELDPLERYEKKYHVPVIPGSEIRGVIRSVYETLTDSCMGILNDKEYPVKRSPNRFIPALIHKDSHGNMELLEASSSRIGNKAEKNNNPKGFDKYDNGTKLYYANVHNNGVINDYSIKMAGKYNNAGYLIKWGMGVKKARYHVFTPKNSSNEKWHKTRLKRDEIERKLNPVIESYLSQPAVSLANKNAYEEYKMDLKAFLKTDTEAYFPVTCTCTFNNKIFYLAPAIFAKEVSDNNIGKLAGKFNTCSKEACPACELFGRIGKDNISSDSSKVRFSDLYVTKEINAKDYYVKDFITIPALGEPKLGNTEFYLKKPEGADFWTYDYYTKDGKTYVTDGQLKGRKFYWHHHNKNVYDNLVNNADIVPSKLNKTIRPVREGISFKGKLFFDGISKKQIKQLVWLLNSSSEGIGYKLGGAKPYGLGSVVSEVDKVKIRSLNTAAGVLEYVENEYYLTESFSYDEAGFSNNVKDEFFKISGLKTIPDDIEITYPKTIEQKGKLLNEGYKWFMNNHATTTGKKMPRRREEILIREVLPEVGADNVTLSYNKPMNSNNSYSGNSKKTSNWNKGKYAANNKYKPR